MSFDEAWCALADLGRLKKNTYEEREALFNAVAPQGPRALLGLLRARNA